MLLYSIFRKLAKLKCNVQLTYKSVASCLGAVETMSRNLKETDRRLYNQSGVALGKWLPFENARQVEKFFADDPGTAQRQLALKNLMIEISRGEPRSAVAREVIMLTLADSYRQVFVYVN